MPIEVRIEKQVYGGEGLARTPEGVILVPGALPEERVLIELEPAKRGVRRARLLNIVEPSQYRIAAPCPYFSTCGGCQHQQIVYEKQLEWKAAILTECLERIGKVKTSAPVQTISAEPWGYRNRIRLHAQKLDGRFQIGFQRPASNDLCTVDSCAISAPAIQNVVQVLASGKLAESFPDGQFEVELFSAEAEGQLLATITSESAAPEQFIQGWNFALPAFESVCWLQQRQGGNHSGGGRGYQPIARVWGSGGVTVRVGEFHYRVSHESFFQTNRFLLGEMIEAALGNSAGERTLDLYAGVGFFTVPLTRRFKHVIAVESFSAASSDLQTNAGVAVSQIYVYPNSAESFVASRPFQQDWDLMVVDPPRHGLSAPVRNAIVEKKPKQLVYVSCDPTTLARDLHVFSDASYDIGSIHLIDLFPQTYHLEAIVRLNFRS